MSIRHLDHLLAPASVAVIGASQRPASVGATVWRNLHGNGFKGRSYAVNPKHSEFDGEPVYPRVAALPEVPELAIVCTPPATVPGLIAELAEAGTRAAVVLTAGLDKASDARLAELIHGHRADGGIVIAATHLPLGLEGAKALRMDDVQTA